MTDILNRMGRRLLSPPDAQAMLHGSDDHADVCGVVRFYGMPCGVLVAAAVSGGDRRIAGFHIHEGGSCTGTEDDPFADVGGHYDPDDTEHPFHAGDLPPLFFGCRSAAMAVLTDRFCVSEILGRTVILHALADDLMSQPSGNSGAKVACGTIRRCR